MAESRDKVSVEAVRLADGAARKANWQRWGPYLSERQWGTVREDYSHDGDCWNYFPFDQARRRAYRWGEDGLMGITDRECRLCFCVGLWNGRDPMLKDRLFGLTGPQGNHGEDVKECYYYLDSTPTHSYMKALYKYPQAAFPYEQLLHENRHRSRAVGEYELADTGVFNDNRYFDVFAEYAKAAPDDILIRLTVVNRGPETASLHVVPTLWFRNSWSWGSREDGCIGKPSLRQSDSGRVAARHDTLGDFILAVDDDGQGPPAVYFTENETNARAIFGSDNVSPWTKDGIERRIIAGDHHAVNPAAAGTKAAFHRIVELPPQGSATIRLRLCAAAEMPKKPFGRTFDTIFRQRVDEADAFFASRISPELKADQQRVARQAYAGLLWSKQFYHYIVHNWLAGDPLQPPPPRERADGRNRDWPHLYNRDVISMPDKWEYPWYAAWDLAFHMIPFARIDADFAKQQLLLLLREWYMHPNGQIPAYEFAFSDVNPPVHAWACWRVYKMTGKRGSRDRAFLEKAFHKLLLNFNWWVNRKDIAGKHLFSGGFLGLDNIGVFDRSTTLAAGSRLDQADGTAWMAFFCGTMLSIALELAEENAAYEDVASKFFEHYVAIADAINELGGTGLWDEEDGFYYDRLHLHDQVLPLKTRSLVGLVPLFAVEVLELEDIDKLPAFKKRMTWFLENRADLGKSISFGISTPAQGTDHPYRLLALPSRERLERLLRYICDEKEFLSPYGIRSLSKVYGDNPYAFNCGDQTLWVKYEPAESASGIFGGNSNWRGPIWLPMNFLLIEALERYHHFYGDDLKTEFPTGSGTYLTLKEIADSLSERLTRLFVADKNGRRPCHGDENRYADDDSWRDLVLFHEYFHGDTGRGLGASHQTGWTALVARLLDRKDGHRR